MSQHAPKGAKRKMVRRNPVVQGLKSLARRKRPYGTKAFSGFILCCITDYLKDNPCSTFSNPTRLWRC